MDRSIVVFLALSICLAQCASIKGKDQPNEPIHKRGKRSCHVCDEDNGPPNGPFLPHPPPPPPPPPFFNSIQYSGLARDNDGVPQGVYSGAAAAASGLNSQGGGQSVSLALANTDRGDGGQSGFDDGQTQSQRSGSYGGKSFGSGGQFSANSASGFGSNSVGHGVDTNAASSASSHSGIKGGQSQRSSYGGQSSGNGGQFSANSASGGAYGGQSSAGSAFQGAGGNGNSGGYGQKKSTGSESFKESQYSYQRNDAGGSGFGGHSSGSAQAYGSGGNEQQEQNLGFGHGAANHEVELRNEETQSAGNGQGQSPTGVGSTSAGTSGSGYQSSKTVQSSLSGALNLAHQGLASQSGQPHCSTCGSGSYALSNANSKSGDAVAVSVSG